MQMLGGGVVVIVHHHQKTVNCLRGAVGLRVIMNAVMLESKFERDTRLNRNAVEEHVDH